MKKIIGIVCICLIITILSLGCVEKKVYNETVRKHMVYSTNKLPKNLLMLNSDSVRSQDIILALFEGLICKDDKENIVPGLAKSWSISKDKLTYTFKIRKDAMWSDGEKITAYDFSNFFLRILKEKDSIYSEDLYCIFGVKDYVDKKSDESKVAIIPKDTDTLYIRLNYPCDDFLNILSEPIFSLRKNFLNLKNWREEYKNIKYSGPFIIEDIKDNIILKKNNNYWDKDSIKINRFNIKEQKIDAFSMAEYKSNKVDILNNILLGEVDNFNEDESVIRKSINKGVSVNFNILNSNRVFFDINLRKAIKYGINKNNIENRLKGIITKSNFYIPNNFNINRVESKKDEQNVIKAKEFIKKSKYNGEVIKIIYDTNEDIFKYIALSIKKDLKDLNLNVELKSYDDDALKKTIDKKDYDIVIKNYICHYESPVSFLEKWLSNSKENIYGYKNIEYDRAVSNIKTSENREKINNEIKTSEKILLSDVPTIPIGFYNIFVCRKKYLSGVFINDKGNIILKNIYINKF